MRNEQQNDELKEAPFLRSLPKQDPFIVPEGFFEGFPHEMQARVVKRSRPAIWDRVLRPLPALGVIILLVIGTILWNRETPALASDPLADEATQYSEGDLDAPLYWMDEYEEYLELASAERIDIQPGAGFTQDELGAYLTYSDHLTELIAERP